jgi:AsmA protein
MKKALKYTLFTLAGLLLLLAFFAAYIAATFNPNDYKPLVIKLVQDKKQRTLHLDGDIKLAFWPKIGADLGKLSISEHKSEAIFAEKRVSGRYRVCGWRTGQYYPLQRRHHQF